MRVLLVLSRAVRGTGRFLATAALSVPYVAGRLVGLVVVVGISIGAAARLGWNDAHRPRRDGHGAA